MNRSCKRITLIYSIEYFSVFNSLWNSSYSVILAAHMMNSHLIIFISSMYILLIKMY